MRKKTSKIERSRPSVPPSAGTFEKCGKEFNGFFFKFRLRVHHAKWKSWLSIFLLFNDIILHQSSSCLLVWWREIRRRFEATRIANCWPFRGFGCTFGLERVWQHFFFKPVPIFPPRHSRCCFSVFLFKFVFPFHLLRTVIWVPLHFGGDLGSETPLFFVLSPLAACVFCFSLLLEGPRYKTPSGRNGPETERLHSAPLPRSGAPACQVRPLKPTWTLLKIKWREMRKGTKQNQFSVWKEMSSLTLVFLPLARLLRNSYWIKFLNMLFSLFNYSTHVNPLKKWRKLNPQRPK